jgi:hypothetical protein
VWAMCVLGLQGLLAVGLEVSDIVDVECARVGGEDNGLRREGVNECGWIDVAVGAVRVSNPAIDLLIYILTYRMEHKSST